MRIVLKVIAVIALGFFLYDYYQVRADAICAHNNIIHLEAPK